MSSLPYRFDKIYRRSVLNPMHIITVYIIDSFIKIGQNTKPTSALNLDILSTFEKYREITS